MSNLPELWVLRTCFSSPALSVPAGTVVRLLDGEADGDPEYAQLGLLDGKARRIPHRLAHSILAVSNHHHRRFGGDGSHIAQSVHHQRLACQGVQHFGQPGAHARDHCCGA